VLLTVSAAALMVADLSAVAGAGAHGDAMLAGLPAAAAATASLPAIMASLYTDPQGGLHLRATLAWTALRIIAGVCILPLLVLVERDAGRFYGCLNLVRTVSTLALVTLGAMLAEKAPSGEMDGRTQFNAVAALLAHELLLLPEASRVRITGLRCEVLDWLPLEEAQTPVQKYRIAR